MSCHIHQQCVAEGEFIMEDMNASTGETIHIPLKIINDSNIHSFSGIMHYNPEVLLLDTITTGNYFSNSILISNKNDEGEAHGISGLIQIMDLMSLQMSFLHLMNLITIQLLH